MTAGAMAGIITAASEPVDVNTEAADDEGLRGRRRRRHQHDAEGTAAADITSRLRTSRGTIVLDSEFPLTATISRPPRSIKKYGMLCTMKRQRAIGNWQWDGWAGQPTIQAEIETFSIMYATCAGCYP